MNLQQKRYLFAMKALAIMAVLYGLGLLGFQRIFADVQISVVLIVVFVSVCSFAPIALFIAVLSGRLDRFIER